MFQTSAYCVVSSDLSLIGFILFPTLWLLCSNVNYLGMLSLKLAYTENCLFCLSKHSFVWRNCCKDVAIEHRKIHKQCCLNFCSHPPKCSLLHNNAKHIIKTQSKLMARSHCLLKSLAGVSVNLWNVYCMLDLKRQRRKMCSEANTEKCIGQAKRNDPKEARIRDYCKSKKHLNHQ